MSKIEEKPQYIGESEEDRLAQMKKDGAWKAHICPDAGNIAICADDSKHFPNCKCFDEAPSEQNRMKQFTKYDGRGAGERPSSMPAAVGEEEGETSLTYNVGDPEFRQEISQKAPEIFKDGMARPHGIMDSKGGSNVLEFPLQDYTKLTMEAAFDYMRKKGDKAPSDGMIIWTNDEGQTCWINFGDLTNAYTLWALESIKHQLIARQFEEDE